MFWTQRTRRPNRASCQPTCEGLEVRNLLSTATPHISHARVAPHPAASSGPAAAADGFDNIIQASAARAAYHVSGTGSAAAVIDEGVNYNNQALGGGLGNGFKVEAGADLAVNSSDPNATTTQHGTAVAGILASGDSQIPGVAPGADIVALKVFDNNGNGSFTTIANALQYVIDHHTQDHITVVNLSISDGNNYAMDWFSQDGGIGQRIAGLVHQLDLLNIPVVTATGNSFNGQAGMGFTAILPETISVTATNGANHFASDAQRMGSSSWDPGTSLAAPGVGLTAPSDGNNRATVDGTSFAAPQVSGAIILLQQIYEARFGQLPKVSDVLNWLQAGSTPVHDPVTGATIGLLNVLKAAEHVPGAVAGAPAPLGNPVAPGTAANPPEGQVTAPSPPTSPAPSSTPNPSPPPSVPSTPPPSSQGSPTNAGIPPSTGTQGSQPVTSLAPPITAPPTSPAPSSPPTTPAQSQPPPSTSDNNSSSSSAQQTVNPAPTTPAPSALVDLVINGQSAGQVDASSVSNPFADFATLFGVQVTFQKVQVWASSPVEVTVGDAAPSGTVHENAPTVDVIGGNAAALGSGGTVRIASRPGRGSSRSSSHNSHRVTTTPPTPHAVAMGRRHR
jgi:hypothetical protein